MNDGAKKRGCGVTVDDEKRSCELLDGAKRSNSASLDCEEPEVEQSDHGAGPKTCGVMTGDGNWLGGA